MTYCVALKLETGLVFASDSRTNAGVDQISSYKKMRTFVKQGDRAIVVLSSGNLSITQNALHAFDRLVEKGGRSVWTVDSLHDVAELLGEALRSVRGSDGVFLAQNNIDSGANFIVGGQIVGEPMRLFMIYSEGNFIEAGNETPYFQIGETKYGKPIIDRVVRTQTAVDEAIKCLLVSFDTTMRSNLSVGLPIDLSCYTADSFVLDQVYHITEEDPYFARVSRHWSDGVRGVFASLPNPEWLESI